MPIMRDTIKKHVDFKTADSCPCAKSAYFLVRAKMAKNPDNPQYGLIVTKRTFKHAVDRNRAKRLLRDWIAHNDKFMRPDWDYVFVARRSILDADRTSGRTAMKKALHYMRKQQLDA